MPSGKLAHKVAAPKEARGEACVTMAGLLVRLTKQWKSNSTPVNC